MARTTTPVHAAASTAAALGPPSLSTTSGCRAGGCRAD
jgi:hypothetical protein